MNSESDNQGLKTLDQGSVPTKITLAPTAEIDISWLPQEKREALLHDYTKGMMDISLRAQELNVDSAALKKTLDDMSDTTKQHVESGAAVTMSHTQTTSVGRTEVMMGNTEKAQTGKLSRSQAGEKDWTPLYVIGGVIALLIVVSMFKG